MKTDRIIAFGLIALCFLSVLIGIFFQTTPPVKERQSKSTNVFNWQKSGFGTEKADIAVIDISGMIVYGANTGWGSTDTDASNIIQVLEEIKEENIKGILFRLNSPGGTASASQAIYDKVMELKKESGIKVYSTMLDISASGAYYIASASDVIYAHPATLTGSIGVIMQIPNIKGLGEKIGYRTEIIKSGQFKDIGEPTRDLSGEERVLLQGLVDDTYNQFIQAVATGRNLPLDEIRTVSDGRIYTGNQALENRLVDKLGSQEDALEEMAKELNIQGKPALKNFTEPNWEKILFGIISKDSLMDTILGSPDFQTKYNKIPLMLYK